MQKSKTRLQNSETPAPQRRGRVSAAAKERVVKVKKGNSTVRAKATFKASDEMVIRPSRVIEISTPFRKAKKRNLSSIIEKLRDKELFPQKVNRAKAFFKDLEAVR